MEIIWNRVREFFSGSVPRGTLLSALIPLIFICYFGTITFVALVLPERYDWRSSVISNLLSPRHSPQFHWVASLGLSLTGFLAIPFYTGPFAAGRQRGREHRHDRFYHGIRYPDSGRHNCHAPL
jgi:hypothetical protein